MKKFRKFTILWGMILVFIFVLFTMYSFKLDKKIKEYHYLEEYFANAVAEYNNTRKDYPQTIEVINFSLSEAIEKGIVSELKIDNDICDGYVKIANDEIVTYTPYISCKNYTTKGYTKNLN